MILLVAGCMLCVCVAAIVVVIIAKNAKSRGSQPQTTPEINTGDTTLTNYWVPEDGGRYLMDCGTNAFRYAPSTVRGQEVTLGSAPGGKMYVLKDGKGKTLTKVDAYLWDACYCEGSCHVGGDTYNLQKEGKDPRFSKTRGITWGIGSKNNRLVPFVSVTADSQYPYGTKLYIRQLDGIQLPSGDIHNGCVRVDDSCGDGCTPNQIDWHVGVYKNYVDLSKRLPEKVSVRPQKTCIIKSYRV